MDQRRFESFIDHHSGAYNSEEIALVNSYLSKYEEIYERLKTVMQSVTERLNGKDPVVVYKPSSTDIAFSHLSSVMKRLKQNMDKVAIGD